MSKEKAIELVEKYWNLGGHSFDDAKEMAIIACEEIIIAMDKALIPNPFKLFYQQTIEEIKKL